MAESLMVPAPEVDKSALDAGYGEDFEGFAEAAGAGGRGAAVSPDSRPHTQRQFGTPPSRENDASDAGASCGDDAAGGGRQRDAAGSALADAKRLAEGSGMLGKGSKKSGGGAVAGEPVQKVSRPRYDSPFKVAADQSEGVDDPLGRQVDLPEEKPASDDWAESKVVPPSSSGADTQAPPPFKPEAKTAVPEPRAPGVRPASAAGAGAVARGPFLSRLQQFSAIIRRDLDARAMFLIDNDGHVLLDEVGNPKLIQVARTLANASYRASQQTAGAAAVGNLHVKIGASATLEVIPVKSRYGLLILGAIFPAPLGAARVRQVADVLARTVEPRG